LIAALLVAVTALVHAPVTAAAAVGSVHLDVRAERDIQYGEAGGVALLLDAYVPSSPGSHPAMLVIHGGTWNSGDKRDMAVPSEAFADAGFAAFAVNYRLAPVFTYPSPLEDLQAAVRWIRTHASEYHVDRGRIGAFGVSAGGHLASLLATVGKGSKDDDARVRVAMSWSGPQDLTSILGGFQSFGPIDAFIGCSLAACPKKWRQASPVAHVDPTDAPLLLANSSDELVPFGQASEMAGALRRHRVPARLIEIPGDTHVLYGFVQVGPRGKTVTQLTLDFARKWIDEPRSGGGTASPTNLSPKPTSGVPSAKPASPTPPALRASKEGGKAPLLPIAAAAAGIFAIGALLVIGRLRR